MNFLKEFLNNIKGDIFKLTTPAFAFFGLLLALELGLDLKVFGVVGGIIGLILGLIIRYAVPDLKVAGLEELDSEE